MHYNFLYSNQERVVKIFSFVEIHVCALPLVTFRQQTNFFINFPPIKIGFQFVFWYLISLIVKLVRNTNSWFHATIEIIKEPKKNIKCVTMVKHQFVFSRINYNLIVIVAGGSNNNKQLPNN